MSFDPIGKRAKKNLDSIIQVSYHVVLRKGGQIMYLRRTFSALAVVIALAATMTEVNAQPPDILGTWDATLSIGTSFREKERYTFTAGRTHEDGSVIFSNEEEATPPCTTDHGVWAKTGARTYTLTHGAFCGDVTIKWREVITLGPRAEGFTGRGVLEKFDPFGLFFIAHYTLRGARMHVEPPPPAP